MDILLTIIGLIYFGLVWLWHLLTDNWVTILFITGLFWAYAVDNKFDELKKRISELEYQTRELEDKIKQLKEGIISLKESR